MSEQNKAIVRRFFEEYWNKGNMNVADEIFASDYVHTAPDGGTYGAERAKHNISRYRTSFPDITFTIVEMIAEGDKVVTSWTGQGAHRVEYDGIPPTGKQVTLRGIEIQQIVGGKIVGSWRQWDRAGLMRQIGAIPTP